MGLITCLSGFEYCMPSLLQPVCPYIHHNTSRQRVNRSILDSAHTYKNIAATGDIHRLEDTIMSYHSGFRMNNGTVYEAVITKEFMTMRSRHLFGNYDLSNEWNVLLPIMHHPVAHEDNSKLEDIHSIAWILFLVYCLFYPIYIFVYVVSFK